VLILLLIFLLNILIGNFIPKNRRINKIKENTCLIISNEILNEFFMFDSDTLKIQAISDRIYYTNLSLNNNRQILIDNILKDINIDAAEIIKRHHDENLEGLYKLFQEIDNKS